MAAQALATPVRQCALTFARLPSHFLLPLVTQITTKSPKDDATPSNQTQARLIPNDLIAPGDAALQAPARSYILNQQRLLTRHFNLGHKWSVAVTERMRRWYALKKGKRNVNVAKEWEWDFSTVDKFLAKYRQDVMQAVQEARRREAVFTTHEWSQRDTTATMAACIVKMTSAEDKQGEELMSKGVPIYDLGDLLGEATAQAVVESDAELADSCAIVVEKSTHTAGLQLALLKLKGFASGSVR